MNQTSTSGDVGLRPSNTDSLDSALTKSMPCANCFHHLRDVRLPVRRLVSGVNKRLARQRGKDGGRAVRHVARTIPALQHKDDLSIAMLVRQFHQSF